MDNIKKVSNFKIEIVSSCVFPFYIEIYHVKKRMQIDIVLSYFIIFLE
jgi:hypothetical protein